MNASTLKALGGLILWMTLADRIKEAMGSMTPAELARGAGVSDSAVSQWLDGTTKNLKAESAAKIEMATGYSAVWLATNKGPKRRQAEPPPEYAGAMSGAKRVPIVGTAKLGDNGYYEEISSIPGAGDGHIEHVSRDEGAYGLRVRGNSMFPAIKDGWYVIVEPNSRPVVGEYVLVKLLNGQKMVKELLIQRADSIEIVSVNGGERRTVYNDELESVQAVASIVGPSKWKPD